MNEGLKLTSLKLFLFTGVTIVVTVWLASIIGNFQLFSQPYQVTAEFSDASGLLVGDQVKASGVTIGRVDEIKVRNGLAVVTMSIDQDVDLPRDVDAQIRFRNLIGQRMVAFVQPDDSSTAELMRDEDLIPLDRTRPAFDLSELFNGLRPLIRSTSPHDINVVSQTLTEVLQGRTGEIESLLTNVSEISEVIASKDQELNTLLDGLNVVSEDLAGRDRQLEATLTDINRFFTKVSRNKRALASAFVNLEDAATRLDSLVRTNDKNIESQVKSLAGILDVVNRHRTDLRSIVRSLPEMLVAVERVTGYGEWTNIHLIDVCKDDFGLCGTRGTP